MILEVCYSFGGLGGLSLWVVIKVGVVLDGGIACGF